jgi:hypothetical protein
VKFLQRVRRHYPCPEHRRNGEELDGEGWKSGTGEEGQEYLSAHVYRTHHLIAVVPAMPWACSPFCDLSQAKTSFMFFPFTSVFFIKGKVTPWFSWQRCRYQCWPES